MTIAEAIDRVRACPCPHVSFHKAEILAVLTAATGRRPAPDLPPLPDGFKDLEIKASQAGLLSVAVSASALRRLCQWAREAGGK